MADEPLYKGKPMTSLQKNRAKNATKRSYNYHMADGPDPKEYYESRAINEMSGPRSERQTKYKAFTQKKYGDNISRAKGSAGKELAKMEAARRLTKLKGGK